MLLKGFYAGHALWPRFSLSTEERILLVTARFQSTCIVFYPHFISIVVEDNNNTACRNLTSTALTVAISFIFAIVCARSQVLSPLGYIIPLPNFTVLFPLSSYHSLPLFSSVLWDSPYPSLFSQVSRTRQTECPIMLLCKWHCTQSR